MGFILWLIVGGVLGWVASMIMGTNDKQGIFLNVVVGIVGAFIGGLLLAPLFGTGTINAGDFSIGSLLVSLVAGGRGDPARDRQLLPQAAAPRLSAHEPVRALGRDLAEERPGDARLAAAFEH